MDQMVGPVSVNGYHLIVTDDLSNGQQRSRKIYIIVAAGKFEQANREHLTDRFAAKGDGNNVAPEERSFR